MVKKLDSKIKELDIRIKELESSPLPADELYRQELIKKRQGLIEHAWENLMPSDRVYLARRQNRPKTQDYINYLFDDFFEIHGDRLAEDDKSILTGLAYFEDIAVTIIGQRKGNNLEENLEYNFGMPSPSGYRKVIRLAKQAEKFNRPIISFIDTPGAYPGIQAEERGQGEAIARTIATFSSLQVPIISIIIGEGGSGGALAIGMANKVLMLENAIYSILSPEGFASILWKDSRRADEASEIMKLTAKDLKEFKIIDYLIEEERGGINNNMDKLIKKLHTILHNELRLYRSMNKMDIANERYDKYRKYF